MIIYFTLLYALFSRFSLVLELGLGLGLGFRVSVSVWLDVRRLWTRRKLRCHTCSTRSGGQGLGLVEMIVDAYHGFEVFFFFFSAN